MPSSIAVTSESKARAASSSFRSNRTAIANMPRTLAFRRRLEGVRRLPNGPSAVDEQSREHSDATRQFPRREKWIRQTCQPSAEKAVGSRNDDAVSYTHLTLPTKRIV